MTDFPRVIQHATIAFIEPSGAVVGEVSISNINLTVKSSGRLQRIRAQMTKTFGEIFGGRSVKIVFDCDPLEQV